MIDDLAARATVLADLLQLCARIGAAPQLREDGSVWLIGPGDAPPRRLGDTFRASSGPDTVTATARHPGRVVRSAD